MRVNLQDVMKSFCCDKNPWIILRNVKTMYNLPESEQFEKYFELLLKWNAKTNLTAITSRAEVIEKHFADSLALLPFLPSSCRVLDLGTGGGFPGIPLKIANSSLEMVLVDAKQKKISFLQAVIAELGLVQVAAIAGRAEDLALQQRLGKFDVVVSRATWELKDYLKAAHPYLKKGGQIIAMKGAKWQEELSAAQEVSDTYGLKCQKIHHYELSPGLEHHLLLFSKETVVSSEV